MMRALALCLALALLVPPGPEGVLLGALFTAVGVAAALGIAQGFLASAIAFTLNAIVGAVISTAISLALSVFSRPDRSSPQAFGVQTRMRTGGEVPRSFMLGRGATAGSLVYFREWGQVGNAPNGMATWVIALSDLPVKGLRRLFVNGEPVTITANTNDYFASDMGFLVEEYTFASNEVFPNGSPYLWVKFYDGTQTTADPFLVNTVSTSERPWENTRVGVGVAYAVITARVNGPDNQPWSGLPSFRFELDGIPLYDPSRDGSEAGTGLHRYNTPATWDDDTDSRDLMGVQIYNLLRGIEYNGEWFYGLQDVDAPQLPAADWVTAIEAARTAGFKAGGEITVDTEIGDALEMLMAAGQARIADYAGTSYKLFVGAPGSPVASFGDDDIVATLPGSFTPFPGLADSVNGVIATYASPDEAWNMRAAPPLYDAEAQAADGGRRLPVRLELPAVYDDEQVQRLAKAALKESLRARRHTIALPAPYYALEPGDVVQWTSGRWGYAAKLFRVDGVVRQSSLDVICDLTEVDPADFEWNTQADYTPVTPIAAAANRPSPHATTISVAPFTATIGGVGRRPGIEITWTTPDDTTALEWQVRIAATSDLVAEGVAAIDSPAGSSGLTRISVNLVSNTQYQVRGRWVPGTPRQVLWSSWLAVTTPDVRLQTADIGAAVIELNNLTQGVIDTIGGTGAAATAEAEAARDAAQLAQAEAEQAEADAVQAALDADADRVAAEAAANTATSAAGTATTKAAEASADAAAASSASAVAVALLGGWNHLCDGAAALTAGQAVTLSNGASGDGLTNTTLIRDAATAPITSGTTNGAYVEIPADVAMRFSGRKVRVTIRARQPGSSPATTFYATYSTSDAGNSGLRPLGPLTNNIADYSFVYDVPQASFYGTDVVGVYADTDVTGSGVEASRIIVQDATEAEAAASEASSASVSATDAETAAGVATTRRDEATAARDAASGSASAGRYAVPRLGRGRDAFVVAVGRSRSADGYAAAGW